MKYSEWNISGYDMSAADEMRRRGIPLLVAMVLASRGVTDADSAVDFLNEGEHCYGDPMALPDMGKAVDRIRLAAERDEFIAVYGDYDVDGITSLSLVLRCFREKGLRCMGYIPDRVDEGYGLNREALDYIARQGATLIVTVDCGITAIEETEYARELGMDVIVTDHHECKDKLPAAVAIVNPRRQDCDYPFKQFAGVGVAYKLLCALFGRYCTEEMMDVYSPLVAIGTVADVMPLIDENRAIVRKGLEAVSRCPVIGLRKLLESSGLADTNITSANISYILAPRINAAGRMGKAEVAVELMLTTDEEEAERLAEKLCELNRERQQIENEIFKDALEMLKTGPGCGAVILAGEGWHQGVIGIVASRLAERCNAPAFLVSLDGEYGKASCRSYGGFNLFLALEQAAELLENFGGHALAAGFTIKRENIAGFIKIINKLWEEYAEGRSLEPVLNIDCCLEDPKLLTVENVEGLRELEPIGAGNAPHIFCMTDVEILSATGVSGGKHLKLLFMKDGKKYDGIFFSNTAKGTGIGPGDIADVAFTPEINEFRGRSSVQLIVRDIRQNSETRRLDAGQIELYEKFRRGGELSADEVSGLLPPREDFVAIWRYLKNHSEDGEIRGERTYLARAIARAAGMKPSIMRMLICVDVLSEMELIEVFEQGTGMRIKIREVNEKIDLSKSKIIKKLRSSAGR